MTETIAKAFVELLESYNIPDQLIPFIVSLFPVLELRGGMIAAAFIRFLNDVNTAGTQPETFGQLLSNLVKDFIPCYIGNMLPIPFILIFIRKIFQLMRKVKFLSKIVDKLEARANKKKGTIDKYKEWGLLIFVAIPLPGTGGWTGALIAALMDLRMKKCLPIIALGVFIAGLIMSVITYIIPWLLQ